MALPRTSTSQQTTTTAETSQELNPTWRVQMMLGRLYATGNWTDVTTLVRSATFVRGRADELQDYSTLSMTIVFDNSSFAFTPEFSALITPSRPMRILCEYEGEQYVMATGFVDEWRIEYPLDGKDAITIAECVGAFSFLSNSRSDTFLDVQLTTARIVQMVSEVGNVEVEVVDEGTIYMPEFELYDTEVYSVVKQSALTEFGQLYETKTGKIRFEGRGRRFQNISPRLIFGDDPDTETAYEEAEWSYSGNKIVNRAVVTADPDDPQIVVDLTSARLYGTRQYSIDIDAQNGPNDTAYNTVYAESLANFIIGRYSEPSLRVNNIRLHPAGRESVWPVLLSLELNERVDVHRRPPGYTPELTTSTSRKTQAGIANVMA